ncbi:MAG: hypothetical protein IAX21_08405 [Candidatus Bathyarchaeota archaeon]|nr:MAG: hypothetical protein IAX21_08405 [Candidatus Bathyarchaeota archaeon]
MSNQKTPKYWTSWKGRVIKAIVLDGAKKWNEIREITALSKPALNRVIAELYNAKVITNENSEYIVAPEISAEYKKFSELEQKNNVVKVQENQNNKLTDWIKDWKKFKSLEFSMDNNHFFLTGRYLDEISKELITKAEQEVLVINPFVDQCHLSSTLRESSKKGIKVKLITRFPEDGNNGYRTTKKEYHMTLQKEGVTLAYNKQVHAKLIVVDSTVAIVSSMNFFSASSGGSSWEAGMISTDEKVIRNIKNSISDILDRP